MWPVLVKPTLVIDDITELDLAYLQTLGVQGFVFDLDNTLMVPHTGVLEASMVAWLDKVRGMGFRCICVTNNKRPEYYNPAGELLDMPMIGHAAKPGEANLIRAVNMLALEPFQVAVVGDRPLTDILGGHRIGAHTILVGALNRRNESAVIQFLRRLERLVIRTA